MISDKQQVKLQPESSNCPCKNNNWNENNYTNNNDNEKKTRKGKRVFIIGDSTLKHVNNCEITKKLENCKVYVKSFPGAKIKYMEDYAQPTIKTKPDHPRWYKRSTFKERVSRNFQGHRGISFKTETRHFFMFYFQI